MKVLHLASGRKYDVWAMCDEDDTCQVLEELRKVNVDHGDLVAAMAPLLLDESLALALVERTRYFEGKHEMEFVTEEAEL